MRKTKPKLRFPEFTDEWQKKEFTDIFERVTRKNKENNQNILTISAQGGLVKQEHFFTKLVSAKNVTGYYLLHNNDYAYNKSYSKGYPMGAVKRLKYDEKGVVSTLYICFRSKFGNELFFDQYIEAGKLNSEIDKIAQEGARNHGLLNIAVGDFFKLNLIIPKGKELEKIADFLGIVDEMMALLSKRKEQLEKYKKGVMQKIFSQEIRFKDKNGQDFPAWQEIKLGSILVERNIQEPANEQYPLMAFIANQGVAPKGERYNREFLVNKGEAKKYKRTEYGDFIYSSNNLETGSIGLNRYGQASISPVYSIFEVDKTCNPIFVESYLLSKRFVYEMTRYRQGVVYGQWRIHESDFLKIMQRMPLTEEQEKIAEFLSFIDKKIEVEERKLEKARKFKKAILQQMFV